MKAATARAMRRIRHDHRWSDLAFVNALRAVLRLEPINGYGELEEVSYAAAWPVGDGCRQRCARTDRGNR